MCGIAGFWTPEGLTTAPPLEALRRMTRALAHRGPDDSGHWCDDGAGIALGHRRLSIIDLSPQGHQPMASADGRWTVVFNGEIYNFRELRRDLEAAGEPGWRGTSDTEVLLAAISRWGLDATLPRLIGMFAFALWDGRERCLHLARDRMGEKPLYYGWSGPVFLFASELKAMRGFPGWQGELDRDVLALYMRYSYVPEPYAIYRGVRKLPPGASLRIPATSATGDTGVPQPYWSPAIAALEAHADRYTGGPQEVLSQLDALLRVAVAGQMVADVPLGAFLSGGIDSSLVVALMQAQSARPVRTFTIGFTEEEFNEANFAREVASHLGTEHTELYVSPHAALDVIPTLPVVYDEPFGDSSQIPTILVSRMTRAHVTVCLSGDGGDELFGGYTRYGQAEQQWRRVRRAPPLVRRALAALVPPVNGHAVKLAQVLRATDRVALYRRLISQCNELRRLVPGAVEPSTVLTDQTSRPHLTDFCEEMMWIDAVSYLPGDILTKVDRAAMSVSLETRIPLLDHRVVEFAWRLPPSLKWHDGRGKWPLRALLDRYVPARLIDRPKRGFGVPINRWLREDLREWAEELLAPANLREGGLLDAELVRTRWQEHLSGAADRRYYLWNVLMFQAWLAAQTPVSARSSPDITESIASEDLGLPGAG
jgi:asparagine synthase (glutamine-hydrolysing)